MSVSLSRRGFCRGVTAAALVAGVPATAMGNGEMIDSLAAAAASQGRYFGAAVRIDQLDAEPALQATVLRDCSSLTPEIHFKWDAIEPAEGHHAFAPADGLAAFAQAHALALRGHTLLWEQSTPAWARAKLRRERDWALVDRHFATMLGRYAGAAAEWDVVNEAIDSQTGQDGFRRNSFFRAFGPDYIARALHSAHQHAPGAKLMINDYGFDYDNPVEKDRRRLMLRLVEQLKRGGVPLHGVGIQAHLDLSKGPLRPEILREFLRDLAALDVEIVITELDVKEADRSAPLALRDARVAAEAKAYLEVALDQPAVRGVVTWGLSDRHSWLQDGNEGSGAALNRGLPYDAADIRKPMYWALRDVFRHGA